MRCVVATTHSHAAKKANDARKEPKREQRTPREANGVGRTEDDPLLDAEKKRLDALQPIFRLSLEDRSRGAVMIDQTDAMLLRRISETGSLTSAARLSGISYRNAWDRIKAIESGLGMDIVQTKVGGAAGGGASLTTEGTILFKDFRKVRKYLFNALADRDFMAHSSYKLSARNRINAKVTKIEKGSVTALIKMTLQAPATLTSIISIEAVDDLALKEGDEVEAVIKSTEVIIAKQEKS